jgi:hypothetical protein
MPHDDRAFVFLATEEIEGFLKGWRSLATTLRTEFDERGAAVIERRAHELENWIAAKSEDAVSVADASDATGYSPDHIRRQLSSGNLPNVGEPGRPRIRRGDLRPKRGRKLAASAAESYDVAADVRALRIRRGE